MYVSRFKLASTINILGLSAGFTVFMIIVTQLWWEYSYNSNIKDSERVHIALIDMYEDGNFTSNIARPFGELFGTSPKAVENYSMIYESYGTFTVFGDHKDIPVDVTGVLPGFVDMFQLEAVEGDLSRIAEKNKVLIPLSMAEKYFEGTSALGKFIKWGKDSEFQEIVGVYRDFPSNSHLTNSVLLDFGDDSIDDMSEWSYSYAYKLREGTDIDSLRSEIESTLINNGLLPKESKGQFLEQLKFVSFDKLYFEGGFGVSGNKSLSLALLAVAILIIIIASANYINLFMALVPIRIKNINISKVFGADEGTLRRQTIFEGVGIAFIAFILSLLAVQLVSNLDIARFTPASISPENNIGWVLIVGALALLIGYVSGVFPSYYITSFSPALVLKGSFGRSAKGRKLRAVLSSFQFIVSTSLIIISAFIILQSNYMKSFDYGFDRDGLVTSNFSYMDKEDVKPLNDELMKHPFIKEVGYSDALLMYADMTWGRSAPNGESMNFVSLPCSWNYPQLMGFELIEGRFFIEDDSSKPGGTAIFNEAAATKFGLKIGDKFNGHSDDHQAEVVGIVKNFNFRSLATNIEPICLYEFGSEGWRTPATLNLRLKEGAELKEITDYVRASIKKLDPNAYADRLRINSLDDSIDALYKKEEKMSMVINIFSMISILISILGLLGIIVFENQYRRKEVSLRKIHGSSIVQILALFSKQSVRMLLVSFIIALPLGGYISNIWLSSYMYRVPLYWWVFPLTMIIVIMIVLTLVISMSFKNASDNPARYLKDN